MKASLPLRVDPAGSPSMPKVAYKYLVFREASFYRFIDLCTSAVLETDNRRFVSSLILIRSAFEVSAALFYIDNKIRSAIISESTDGIDETGMRLLLGARWDDWSHQAINVLSFVDKMELVLPGARSQYDRLSEFAHPNWQGTAMLFSSFDKEQRWTDLGHYLRQAESVESECWSSLAMCLMSMEYIYNNLSDVFPSFIELCRKKFERP
jgi:hypothetical protein